MNIVRYKINVYQSNFHNEKNWFIFIHYGPLWSVWQYRLCSFQGWDTKLERFLSKNQHTQIKIIECCELV